MAADMTERLPREVLAHIFHYLDPHGIVAASSVNKLWKEIINDSPGLLDDVYIHINELNDLNVFSNMSRNFCCFCFDQVDIGMDTIEFLNKIGPKIRCLIFKNNKVIIDLDLQSHKISNLVNLLELRILCSNVEDLFTQLPKLKVLQFSTLNKYFQDDQLRIVELTKLTLEDLAIEDNVELTYFADPTKLLSVMTHYLEMWRSGIELQDRYVNYYMDMSVARVFKIEDLKLKRLKLSRLFGHENTIQAFCASQQGIVALNLVYRANLKDSHMEMICKALSLLEDLNVSFNVNINKSVVQIFQLKYLKKLDLSGCRGIQNESFLDAFGSLACSDLKVLHLKYVKIDNYILSSLLNLLPNLKKITLDEGYILDSRWIGCPDIQPRRTRTYLYQPNL